MKMMLVYGLLLGLAGAVTGNAQSFEKDVIEAGDHDLTITFIGHGTLMLQYGPTVVHVDPVGAEADYTTLPKADLVLVTHEHGDHLDADAIGEITGDGTVLITTQTCATQLGESAGAIVMTNGDSREEKGFAIEAVPAYNIVNERGPGQPFHPKGVGNGYVITSGNREDDPESTLRVYIAGDTENIPEMAELADIDIAFLPMNLPYTMTPEMVADAARTIRPRILYPYHFGNTDTSELVKLLADEKDIEVRIRAME